VIKQVMLNDILTTHTLKLFLDDASWSD